MIQRRWFNTLALLCSALSPCDPNDPRAGPERLLWDYNDVHVLDFAPTLRTLAMVSVIDHKLDTAELPHDVR